VRNWRFAAITTFTFIASQKLVTYVCCVPLKLLFGDKLDSFGISVVAVLTILAFAVLEARKISRRIKGLFSPTVFLQSIRTVQVEVALQAVALL
jgi:hypothetical protein